MALRVTMLDLVTTIAEFAESDAEVVATAAYMLNRGSVRLCGSFAGAKIDLGAIPAIPAGRVAA